MSSRDGGTELSSGERWLGRWMVGVAVFYLLSFANFVWLRLDPTLLETLYPTYDAPITSVAAQATIDSLLMFGVEIAVVAVVLLWASRNPLEHRILFWLVIALEVVRGILVDLYLIFLREYPIDEVYYGFIVLHSVIIVTGYLAYRKAMKTNERTGTEGRSG